MASILWRRCPAVCSDAMVRGEVDKTKVGKYMDGCWVTFGLAGVKLQKSGTIFCPHCGGSTSEPSTGELDRAPSGVVHLRCRLEIVEVEKYEEAARHYEIACCYNRECSMHYLPADCKGSAAEGVNERGVTSRVHSGTQYLWLSRDDAPDSWAFGDDRRLGEPRIDEKGRSWRRCVFCAALLRMEKEVSFPKRINRNRDESDQGWMWNGPAATFLIRRQSEIQAKPKDAENSEVVRV